jgi:hypothetical protein
MEDRAMSRHMLDSLADPAKPLANRAARVINVRNQRAERGESKKHDLLQNLVGARRGLRANQRRAAEVKDAIERDRAGQPKDDV